MLNCPFCNGGPKLQHKTTKGKKYYWVLCILCFCRTPDTFTKDIDAINWWNRRI